MDELLAIARVADGGSCDNMDIGDPELVEQKAEAFELGQRALHGRFRQVAIGLQPSAEAGHHLLVADRLRTPALAGEPARVGAEVNARGALRASHALLAALDLELGHAAALLQRLAATRQ